MRLFPKLLVIVLLFSLLAIASILAMVFPLGDRANRQLAADRLASIASLQVSRLRDARSNSLQSLALISSRTQLRISLDAYLARGEPAARDKMNRILNDALQAVPGLMRIEVFDVGGVVIASTDGTRLDKVGYATAFCEQSLRLNTADTLVQWNDEQTALRSSGPLLLEGRTLGAIVVDSDLTSLVQAFGCFSGLGETGETLLGRKLDGQIHLMLPPRFSEHHPPQAETGLLSAAFGGAAISPGEPVVDYRNKEVLVDVRTLPDAGWGMVVKQDLEEILAPGRIMRERTFGFGGGIAGLAILIGFWTSRQLAQPARHLADVSRSIAEGELDARCVIHHRKDEFGEMARCFNEMAEKLVASQHKLESTVERRTVQLNAANEELARSNGDLEQFAFIASHDLQTPIRNVSTAVSLFRREVGEITNPKAERYLKAMTDSSLRMQDLVSGLLAFSRVNTKGGDTNQSIHTQDLMDAVIEELGPTIEACGATVTVGALPAIHGDELQIRQLVTNLIGNALKYRDANRAPIIDVQATTFGGMHQFAIADNGIGIKPEYRERIFEIFKRLHNEREYQGTGLGLSLCQKIVQRHGGSIWVEGAPDEGSTFYFTLPCRGGESRGGEAGTRQQDGNSESGEGDHER